MVLRCEIGAVRSRGAVVRDRREGGGFCSRSALRGGCCSRSTSGWLLFEIGADEGGGGMVLCNVQERERESRKGGRVGGCKFWKTVYKFFGRKPFS
jgi:hypothetical protein